MMWQFVVSLAILRHELGGLHWPSIKKRIWLNLPRDPRTGKARKVLFLWAVPAIAANVLGGFLAIRLDAAWTNWLPGLDEPSYANLQVLADSNFQGQWWILGLALTSMLFNYLFGEELLFHGVLLPRMAGVFGRSSDDQSAGHLCDPYHRAMRALICGAGIAGLTLACLLDRMDWDVQLVERANSLRREGYMIDFFGPGFDAAENMGLLPRLRQLAYNVTELTYVDRSGRPRAALDYQVMANSLEGRLISLLRGDLALALYEGLSQRVVQSYGCSVRALDERANEVTVVLTDGTRWSGDLVIGADGIHSVIRELAFGPESNYLRYLGFHTAAYTFASPDLHKKLGDQFALTDSVDKTVGLYPIRHDRIAVFTAHRTPSSAIPADPRMAVQTTYSDLGWLVPDALAHCPDPPALYYDQVSQIEMPRWATDRVALVGDACQAVSLLAGQGASLAVAGAQLMASELTNEANVTRALSHYTKRMAAPVADKQAAGRRTAEWFLPSTPYRLLLRRLALRAMALPGFDRLLSSRLVAGAGRIP